ncbi:hypothetical protein A2740_00990 [Candidatus Nomurabacteria bacterium RIFCSPHIGHO2_01_FULL_43_16]|nr:MAG: hypothetical protein A2740_00990 [Candidatus Nomurabacteria bacterium RIFCSPHIGHO2_01_FULL_43_16]OGI97502.1 MAG: hypothetical protein A3A11_02840 [Candidatus Nomurabacteria bacterium RIFCSPLOWO2_01_FULL_43_15]OGJ14419.1 MAG: hypothetical protein A2587_01650 [Candidatus Nomurabacteria bacterium RIFOXYD1_FULL_42_14]
MSFFKNNEGIKTAELKLGDFDQIWTKFCFLDESGSLSNRTDPYFTIGILKMSMPYYLQSKILYERSRRNFHDEIKFNKISEKNIEFAKFIIDSLFEVRSIYFYSYTTHKMSRYFQRNFSSDIWSAYEKITLKMLDFLLAEQEIIILIADHITTPKEIKFEVNVKKNFNLSKKKLAVCGICRFDSKSNDLLQVVDLIIGCVNYDIKYANKLVTGDKNKLEIVEYLKAKLGTKTFTAGFQNHNFRIFVEQDNGHD